MKFFHKALILIALLVSCKSSNENRNIIEVGAILPLTGNAAVFGQSSKNALILAKDEIESDSNTYKIKLVIEDGMADQTTSLNAFNKLVTFNKVGFITTMTSGVSMALAPLALNSNIVLFANTSHPKVTDYPNVLRYSNTAEEEVTELINEIGRRADWKKIYLFAQNDDYGKSYISEFKKSIKTNQNPTICGVEYYTLNTTDFRSDIIKIKKADPDLIVIVGFGKSVGLLIRQLRESNFNKPFLASIGFILSIDAIKSAGQALNGGYYLNYKYILNPRTKVFYEKYYNRFNEEPTPNALIDYGILYMIVNGVQKVGDDPAKFIKYYKRLGYIDLPTGEVSISSKGDIIAPVFLKEISDYQTISLWH